MIPNLFITMGIPGIMVRTIVCGFRLEFLNSLDNLDQATLKGDIRMR